MEEREISITPMFKWLTKRFDKKGKKGKQKTRQLRETEFNVVKEELEEKQVVAFVDNLIAQHRASQQASTDSLRPLLETAVKDAEQMAANIKMKAQQEAEAEAERIISQAKQEAQQIKLSAEIAAEAKLAIEKEAEDILSTVKRKTEVIEAEAKQRTLLYLLRAREEIEKQIREDYKRAYARLSSSLQDLMSEGQNIEVELKNKRAQLWESKSFELKEYEAALLKTFEEVAPSLETLASTETEIEPDIASKEEKTEQPVQLQEEATVSEPVEEATEEVLEQPVLEERPGRGETDSASLKQDSQTLYAGEVELAVAIPVDLKMMSKLYNHLQTIPELRILHTRGSWDRGTTITVVLDKPIPLINIISKIPGAEATPELPQKDDLVKGTSSSLLRGKKKGVRRIKLTLKEVQPR